MSDIEIEQREASSSRVPSPAPGHAFVFTRYQQERAVVMHPDDFHRFQELDEALSHVDPGVLSDVEIAAHYAEDTPGDPIEDYDTLAALFDL